MLWIGCAPAATPRVYFANHTSHGDFVLIWAVPPGRPARAHAAGRRRRLLAQGQAAPLHRRARVQRRADRPRGGDAHARTRSSRWPRSLEHGDSLIVFPEGTRNTDRGDAAAVQERHLPPRARAPGRRDRAGVDREPHRVMPKGELMPVPLLCTRHLRRADHAGARARSKTRSSSAHARRLLARRCERARSNDAAASRRYSLFLGIGVRAARRVASSAGRSSARSRKGAPHPIDRQPQPAHQGVVGDGAR